MVSDSRKPRRGIREVKLGRERVNTGCIVEQVSWVTWVNCGQLEFNSAGDLWKTVKTGI